MAKRRQHRFGPVAYMVATAIAVTGTLFTFGVAGAEAAAKAERFDSVAASVKFAIESELDNVVHLLHGARSLQEVQPDLTQDQFLHFVQEAENVAGVVGWGTVKVVGDHYLVDLFHSDLPGVEWRGFDLAARRDTRQAISRAMETNELTATPFISLPGVSSYSSLLVNPHDHEGGPAFAIVSADELARDLPPDLLAQVAVDLDHSTQLNPPDAEFRNLNVEFGDKLWALTVIARSPDLYPNDLIVPLGLLITLAFVLMGMLISAGIVARRKLRDEVADNDRMNKAREQFIASVSHEIRTPLTAVVGYAEMLEEAWDELTDEEARDMVRQISEQSMEVSALVKDLLVGSRADIETLHLDITRVGVREVTDRALASIPGELRRSIEVGFDDDRAWLADPGRATQIIRNLVVNACKYGGPNVSVESRRLPDAIVLSVVDDGDGVSPEDVERIFQPFASIAKTSQALPSVGLGLYVSASLARAMGGSLNYRRHNGLTAFDLALPIARVDNRLPVS
ncbi:MAG: sensor histidine kinase [Acidimicrobiia bacterium]